MAFVQFPNVCQLLLEFLTTPKYSCRQWLTFCAVCKYWEHIFYQQPYLPKMLKLKFGQGYFGERYHGRYFMHSPRFVPISSHLQKLSLFLSIGSCIKEPEFFNFSGSTTQFYQWLNQCVNLRCLKLQFSMDCLTSICTGGLNLPHLRHLEIINSQPFAVSEKDFAMKLYQSSGIKLTKFKISRQTFNFDHLFAYQPTIKTLILEDPHMFICPNYICPYFAHLTRLEIGKGPLLSLQHLKNLTNLEYLHCRLNMSIQPKDPQDVIVLPKVNCFILQTDPFDANMEEFENFPSMPELQHFFFMSRNAFKQYNIKHIPLQEMKDVRSPLFPNNPVFVLQNVLPLDLFFLIDLHQMCHAFTNLPKLQTVCIYLGVGIDGFTPVTLHWPSWKQLPEFQLLTQTVNKLKL